MAHDRPARPRAHPSMSSCVRGSGLLFAAHWLVPLAIQLPLVLACLVTGHPGLAVLTFVIQFGGARVPYRCSIGATAITVRWAFFTETLPLDGLASASLGPDPRRWVFGRRRAVLTLERHHARPLLFFGEFQRLELLRATLERAGIGDARRRET